MKTPSVAYSTSLLLAVFSLTPSARAEDATTTLSALPWNGAFVKVSDAEKRGTIEFGSNISSFRYHVSASAPIDATSRRAAFVDNSGLTPGVSGTLAVTFSSILDSARAKALELGPPDASCREFAAEMLAKQVSPIPPCDATTNAYATWLQSRAAAALGRTPMPRATASESPFFWEAGLEASGAFDRLEVYPGDAAAETRDIKKWDTRLGVRGVAYWAPWFALTLKTGVGWNHAPSTSTFSRCVTVDSSSDDVSGEQCEDDALLLEGTRSTTTKPYLQWALTGILPAERAKVTPGAEVGMRWDTSGGVPRRHETLTAFLSPTDQPVLTRFGVGLDISHALKDDPRGNFESGKTWYAPFIVVGGTL